MYIRLHLSLENTTDAFIHVTELNNLLQILVFIGFCYFLRNGQKRTFTHRLLLTTESIVLGKLNDTTLQQIKLVVDEWEIVGKLCISLVGALKLTVITKVKKTLDDILLTVINLTQQLLWL